MATEPKDTTKKTPDAKPSKQKTAVKKAAPKKAVPKKASVEDVPSRRLEKTQRDEQKGSLAHLPVILFGAPLGLSGVAAAWREASAVYGSGDTITILATGIALGVFSVLLILYGLKAKHHMNAVKTEFSHPVACNFFAVPTITLILLSGNLVDGSPKAALVIWAIGSLANIAITLAILTSWIKRDSDISQVSPPWFIPIVGNLIIPTGAAGLGYPTLGWMVLGVAVLFWLVLFTLVMFRLMVSKPLESPLRPTMAIFLAPPSLTFINYHVLSGGSLDGPAHMIMGICLFTFLFVLPWLPSVFRQGFSLSWWSLTFPFAALTIACTLYADASDFAFMHSVAICSMALLSVLILFIGTKTLHLVATGALVRPQPTPPAPLHPASKV